MSPSDLRAWRDAMGLTQDKAAEALGMSKSNYIDLEHGRRRTTGKPIEALDKRTELACGALLFAKQAGAQS